MKEDIRSDSTSARVFMVLSKYYSDDRMPTDVYDELWAKMKEVLRG